MKSRYNKKANGLYNVLFSIIFLVLLLLLLDFLDIYKALHLSNKIVFIEPTQNTIILSYVIIITNIIILFFLYNMIVVKRKKLKNLSRTRKIIIIFCFIATFCISIFCFFSYYYISYDSLDENKRNLISTEQIFDAKDVNQINIDIINIPNAPSGATIYDEYIILCTIFCQENKYILESSSFKGYDAMYRYIESFKNVKIYTNKKSINQLCVYENKKTLNTKEKASNNIMYIEKIFSLGDNE